MHTRSRILPTLLSLLSPLLLIAQDPMVFSYRPHWPDHFAPVQHSIAFSGEYTAGSDALYNSFLNSLYKGDFLDSATKAEQAGQLLTANRFGMYAGLSAAYSWRNKPDSLKWEFTIALRDRQSAFGTFAPDAFILAFQGNRPFRGQTADISNSRLTYLHWQQLQFEAKYYTADRKSEAAIGFSFLNGQNLNEVTIRSGKLFTSNDGTVIDASADASYFSNDTAKTKYMSRNGSGTCFNFRFSTLLGDSVSKFRSQLMFSVQDLGYIRWNEKSIVYNTDTSLHYIGVDATNLLLNDSNLVGLPNSDSLIGDPINGQIITFLPLGIRMRYTILTPWKWWGGVDVRLWSYAEAMPQVTLFAGWRSTDFKWSVTGGAAWGGYARLQFPVQVTWNACKNFGVTIGGTNLAGYILPKKTRGQGAYANLTFAF